jgi:hypothetical protein
VLYALFAVKNAFFAGNFSDSVVDLISENLTACWRAATSGGFPTADETANRNGRLGKRPSFLSVHRQLRHAPRGQRTKKIISRLPGFQIARYGKHRFGTCMRR